MRNRVRRCLLSLLTVPLFLPVSASPDAARRYLVEVIVFRNAGPDSSGGELWDKSFALPPASADGRSGAAYPAPSTAMPPAPTPSPGTPREAAISPAGLVHMVDILAKLERSRRYEVLVRRAWSQPMRGRSNAIPVPLGINPALTAGVKTATVYTPPAPVTGSVAIYEQRLLFVAVDVAARIPASPAGEQASRYDPVGREYRISETRRVKLNEVHYFDHPYFGVLVRVSRLEGSQ